MKYLIYFSTFFLLLANQVQADQYQENLCADISKNIRRGEIIPKSCKEIFKESNFFKQVSSKNQNLGVWIKNNMLFMQLETKKEGKWDSTEKFIGGKELSSGDVVDFDISPLQKFSNTFEIHILIEEKKQYKVVSYLSSQKNGQKPRLANFPKIEGQSKIRDLFRSKDNRLWFSMEDNQIYFIKSYANSMSSNVNDHPKLIKLNTSLNFHPSYIATFKEETLFLGEQQLVVFSNEGLKKYKLSETVAETKYEIKDIKILNNNLILLLSDNKEETVLLQPASE